MDELRELTVPAGAPDQNLNAMTDDQLLEQIAIEEKKVDDKRNAPMEIPVEPQQVIAPAAPISAPVQAGQAVTPVQEQQVPAPAPAPTATAQELMDKKGWKSFDDIAKGYVNLEREATRKWQEESRARRQVAPQPMVAPQDVNTAVIDSINSNPVDTIGALAEQRLAPRIAEIEERQREILRHNAVASLASNPRTADFNSPIMQDRMLQIFRENPDWALNIDRHLINVYKIAKSDLSEQAQLNAFQAGKENGQQLAQMKQSAMVEGAGRPGQIPVSRDPRTMPLGDLENTIKAMLDRQG